MAWLRESPQLTAVSTSCDEVVFEVDENGRSRNMLALAIIPVVPAGGLLHAQRYNIQHNSASGW